MSQNASPRPSSPRPPVPVGTVRKPAPPRAATRPPRIYGLDSLRAVAVTAVVVFHLAPSLLPGGFVGVDVFFVLSGFLITTLLVRERVQTGRVSLRSFWTRRARRLLPAMVTVVLTCTAVAGVIGGDVLVGIRSQVLGALTFASNWVYIAQGASYSADLTPSLFANFWSLAVEEQYYLFWPLVLLAVFTVRRSRLTGLVTTGAIAVGSAVWMMVLYSPDADPSRAYFGTDSHLFGLMAGAFFALWFAPRTPRDTPAAVVEQFRAQSLLPVQGSLAAWFTPVRRRWVRRGMGLASAGGLLALSFGLRIDSPFTYRGGLVLASLCSVGLIAFLVRSQDLARRVEVSGLRWVGVRSYGIYLWHWPVLVLVAAVAGADNPGGRTSWTVALVALAITLVAAWASYRFIERRVMTIGIRRLVAGVLRRVRRVVERARAEHGRTVAARARLAGVSFVTVLVAAAVVAAFVRAPAVSSIEAEILAGAHAAQQTQQGGSAVPSPALPGPDATSPPEPAPGDATDAPTPAPSDEPAPTEAPAPPTTPPPGDEVTVIGDSVTLVSVDALQARVPGLLVDAEVSRQMSTVPEIAAGLEAAGTLRPYVVVSLGTNSTVNDHLVDTVVGALGPDRTVVLVTGYGDRSWMAATNDAIRAAPERHPNVVVADWQAAAAAQPDVLGRDGIHPKQSGQELYAQTVTDALVQAHVLRDATAQAAQATPAPQP